MTSSTKLIVGGVALLVLSTDSAQIPTGACVDKQGRKRYPRVPCDKNGNGPLVGYDRNGKPIYQPCDKNGECTPVTMENPLASAMRNVGIALVTAGVLSRSRR